MNLIPNLLYQWQVAALQNNGIARASLTLFIIIIDVCGLKFTEVIFKLPFLFLLYYYYFFEFIKLQF
jgi:hypothetical protein